MDIKSKNKEINDLVLSIKETEVYQNYQKYKKMVIEDSELNENVEKMFDLQKQLVNLHELGLSEAEKAVNLEYENLRKSLDYNVLATLYINSCADMQELLQSVFDDVGFEMSEFIGSIEK